MGLNRPRIAVAFGIFVCTQASSDALSSPPPGVTGVQTPIDQTLGVAPPSNPLHRGGTVNTVDV